jgi:hypothetical protein
MDLMSALKQTEGKVSMVADKVSQLGGKLEDLLFRAQKISAAIKNKSTNNDTMFGYDLAHFRREIRAFSQEIVGLPAVLGSIERDCSPIPGADKFAQSLMRLAGRLHKSVSALHSQALMAHQHIREAEHKIEAWYICQEIEEMTQKSQALPTIAQKIVILTAIPPGAAPPPAPPT